MIIMLFFSVEVVACSVLIVETGGMLYDSSMYQCETPRIRGSAAVHSRRSYTAAEPRMRGVASADRTAPPTIPSPPYTNSKLLP